MNENDPLIDQLERVLCTLHQQQCEKAAKVARRHRATLTAEDLLNPDNFPDIMADPHFTYEDGMAAGILSAKIAVRSFLKEKK